jgi:hypothetical protein
MLRIARLNLVDYFDGLINEVDLKAEKEIAQETEANGAESKNIANLVEFINKKRLFFVDEIRTIELGNLKFVNKLNLTGLEINAPGQLNEMIFESFCFLMSKSGQSIGQLFVIDKYLPEKNLECFKELARSFGVNGLKLSYTNSIFNLKPDVNKIYSIKSKFLPRF